MNREERFKDLLQKLEHRLKQRLGESSSSGKDSNLSMTPVINQSQSLLLDCYDKHSDVFSGTVYHPLSSEKKDIPPYAASEIQYELENLKNNTADCSYEDLYYLIWRFWKGKCGDSALFPADDRLPGTSFFLQMDLENTMDFLRQEDSPAAFLLFQIGPVQSFIAQSRSADDLLSSSYLIAFLSAAALKKVTDEVCPGCVVFPNLREQGIFDIQNQSRLESLKIKNENGKSFWDEIIDKAQNSLANPTIPNRFLALIPAKRAREIAEAAEKTVRDTWKEIADACFAELQQIMPGAKKFEERWNQQAEKFLQITWQTCTFPEKFPATAKLNPCLEHYRDFVEKNLKKSFDDPLFAWSIFFNLIP